MEQHGLPRRAGVLVRLCEFGRGGAMRAVDMAEIAAGVDDRTWLHHLRAGHYSAWVRGAIKDEDLADDFAAVERDRALSAADSRGGTISWN